MAAHDEGGTLQKRNRKAGGQTTFLIVTKTHI
jgi:hypothetical protein